MQTVEQWMTKNPVTIEEDMSIIEAIHLLKDRNISRLPVTRRGVFCGLLTDRMIKDYSPGKSTPLDTWEVHYLLSKARVKDAMNAHPYTVHPDTPLFEAAQLIRDNQLYGICVTDNSGNLAGLLTTANLMEALISICKQQG